LQPLAAEAAGFGSEATVLHRVQLTTDGHGACLSAVFGAFGIDVDEAQLVEIYRPTTDLAGPERKYNPGECCGVRKHRLLGKPIKALVSTSYVAKHEAVCASNCVSF